jgi:hypothetical protein
MSCGSVVVDGCVWHGSPRSAIYGDGILLLRCVLGFELYAQVVTLVSLRFPQFRPAFRLIFSVDVLVLFSLSSTCLLLRPAFIFSICPRFLFLLGVADPEVVFGVINNLDDQH